MENYPVDVITDQTEIMNALMQMRSQFHISLFEDVEALEEYAKKIATYGTVLCAKREAEFLGVMVYYFNEFSENGYAFSPILCVNKSIENQGVLRAKVVAGLYYKALDELRMKKVTGIKLEVRKENAIALKLYKRVGFSITHENESSFFMSAKLEDLYSWRQKS